MAKQAATKKKATTKAKTHKGLEPKQSTCSEAVKHALTKNAASEIRTVLSKYRKIRDALIAYIEDCILENNVAATKPAREMLCEAEKMIRLYQVEYEEKRAKNNKTVIDVEGYDPSQAVFELDEESNAPILNAIMKAEIN